MLITSLDNERIRSIRKLQRRGWREQTGLFYIEGIHLDSEAIEVGAEIESLIICPELACRALPPRIRDYPTITVSRKVFERIAQFGLSQGVGAIVRQRCTPIESLRLTDELCWVAVNGIQCPSNLGTLMRLSDSVGGGGIILIEDPTDPSHPTVAPRHPAAVRSSLGAIFSQGLVRTSASEFIAWKRKHGYQLVGTSPSASVDYRVAEYRRPLILFVGHEWTGLSPELSAMCDVLVKIPMAGRIPSHNVATAAGIVLYEILSRGQPGSGG